jgi:phosphatidylethanolamine/phosphatidyl-N-methylethanolamine N-methyltransferase
LVIASKFEKKIKREESSLFFKRWLKKPIQLGTVAPISDRLAYHAASFVEGASQKVIEIGAGTGRLTRAILKTSISPKNLALIELDKELCAFLENSVNAICSSDKPFVIHGDASQLSDILPPDFQGETDLIISAIPLMYLHPDARKKIIDSCFSALKPSGRLIQVTYSPSSPIAHLNYVQQTRACALWLNVPPGFIWSYQLKTPYPT